MKTTTESKSISIFDTTLRDGEQSPHCSFSSDEKFEIASQLDQMGTDVIEAGFPVNSKAEAEAVREISSTTSSTTCALARVVEQDVDIALETEVDMVHVFASTSDIQLKDSMDASRTQVLERSRQAIRRVKDAGAQVMFSPMDATRTDENFLADVVNTVSDEGVDWINIPDTCGVATPEHFARVVQLVHEQVDDVQISIHPHNDFGLATANALHGIHAGAEQVQVTVNGIGERAGNAAYEEVVMALECLNDIHTDIDTANFVSLSQLVEEASGVSMPANKPIVGDNVFAHESGIHAAGIIQNSSTFEPGVMTPEQVGATRRLVLGKHTGTHTVRKQLEELGLAPTNDEVRILTRRVKECSAEKQRISVDLLKEFACDIGVRAG